MSFSQAWFYRIKSAQRDLIERCGGIVRSAEKCSASKTEVGRWNNQGDPDIMPIAAVMQLEDDCGVPLYPDPVGEVVHAEMPEDAELSRPHFH